MVEVTGLEPAAPWSQTTYATNCATPRYNILLLRCTVEECSFKNCEKHSRRDGTDKPPLTARCFSPAPSRYFCPTRQRSTSQLPTALHLEKYSAIHKQLHYFTTTHIDCQANKQKFPKAKCYREFLYADFYSFPNSSENILFFRASSIIFALLAFVARGIL